MKRVRFFSFFVFLVLALLVVVTSCTTKPKPVYQFSATAEPAEAGTITPTTASVDEGDSLRITAKANEHWVFDRWSGDHTGNTNPANLMMNSDKSVTALFVKRDYPLTMMVKGAGSVEERVVQQKTPEYPHGTVVELNPITGDGWGFIEWGEDLSGTEVPKTITVDGAKNITATFEPTGTLDSRTTYSYDSNNNLIELIGYGSDGSINWRDTYSYDSNNNQIEWVSYDSDGSISRRDSYSYDTSNYLIERVRYGSDRSIDWRDTYSYNSNNNLTESIRYGSDGSLWQRGTYSYDSNNNRIESIGYGPDDSIIYKNTFRYDSNNNRIEWIRYGSDGSIDWRFTYRYDSNNNQIEWIRYGSDGSMDARFTLNPDPGNYFDETVSFDENGSIERIFYRKYNSSGLLIESTAYIYNSAAKSVEAWSRVEKFYGNDRMQMEPGDPEIMGLQEICSDNPLKDLLLCQDRMQQQH